VSTSSLCNWVYPHLVSAPGPGKRNHPCALYFFFSFDLSPSEVGGKNSIKESLGLKVINALTYTLFFVAQIHVVSFGNY